MGKVQPKIIENVPKGNIIASAISCDYLITCGVSNWGGFGVAAGLYALRCCPVFDRYRRYGLGSHELIKMEELVPSKDKVSFFYNSTRICWSNTNIPSRQNCRKSNVEECIFVYMALHFLCRFNKNSLLQCNFLAILPAGIAIHKGRKFNLRFRKIFLRIFGRQIIFVHEK